MGLGGSHEHRAELGEEFGTLLRVSPHQRVRIIADLVAYEQANNPDGGVPDSNPYGIDSYRGRSIVSDAGANDLLSVSSNGQIRTLAVFPNLAPVPVPELSCEPPPGFPPAGNLIPPQPVPTSVADRPDRAYYVGTLTGLRSGQFRGVPGGSKIRAGDHLRRRSHSYHRARLREGWEPLRRPDDRRLAPRRGDLWRVRPRVGVEDQERSHRGTRSVPHGRRCLGRKAGATCMSPPEASSQGPSGAARW